MKRHVLTIFSLLVLAAAAYPVDLSINAGLLFGLRMASNSDISDVYGSGLVLFPQVSVNFMKFVTVGVGYEMGFPQTGKIGTFEEDATLKLSGIEIFAGVQYPLKMLTPYLAVGVGFYSYNQTVDSPYALEVDDSQMGLRVAGGVKFYPLGNVFVALEAKFVALTVKPYDDDVNLGGLRFCLGVGYTFKL